MEDLRDGHGVTAPFTVGNGRIGGCSLRPLDLPLPGPRDQPDYQEVVTLTTRAEKLFLLRYIRHRGTLCQKMKRKVLKSLCDNLRKHKTITMFSIRKFKYILF